jgi:hypothetical protein
VLPYRAPLYDQLAVVGSTAFAVLAAAFVVAGRPTGAGVMILFFLASLLYRVTRIRLASLFDLLLVVAGMVNALGWALDLYSVQYPWFDQVAHGLTTGTVVLVSFRVVYRDDLRRALSRRTPVLVGTIAFLGLGFGAAWELVERALDVGFGLGLQHGLGDTLLDLLADLVGALLAGGLAALHRRDLEVEADETLPRDT